MHHRTLLLLIHLLLSSGACQKLIRLPSKTECRNLASHDNCMTDHMQEYCKPACTEQHHLEVLIKSGIVTIPRFESFYDLHALDIHESPVDFKQFRGKVVLVTNVASYCGEYIYCSSIRRLFRNGDCIDCHISLRLLQVIRRNTTSK